MSDQSFSVLGDDTNVIALANFEIVHGETVNYIFHYTGPMDALEAKNPQKGTKWEEGNIGPYSSYMVVSSDIVRRECGRGEMVVTCGKYELGGGDNTAVTERYEVQFAQTNQPLAFHPNFPARNNDGQDSEDLKKWQKFLASPETVQLEGKFLENPADDTSRTDLPADLKKWANLYNKGIQTYMAYLPVIMLVSTYELTPSSLVSDVGTLGAPPDSEVIPSGFSGGNHWLKTGDNFAQEPGTGKWTRTETWTYAHEWPSLLYEGKQD